MLISAALSAAAAAGRRVVVHGAAWPSLAACAMRSSRGPARSCTMLHAALCDAAYTVHAGGHRVQVAVAGFAIMAAMALLLLLLDSLLAIPVKPGNSAAASEAAHHQGGVGTAPVTKV